METIVEYYVNRINPEELVSMVKEYLRKELCGDTTLPKPTENGPVSRRTTKSVDDLHLEPVFTIDLDEINELAKEDASDMVEKVSVAVVDEEWLKKNPTLRHRISVELESLRGLLKMRRTNEAAHDALVVAIGRNPDQGSLYKALTDMQRTGLAITGKINETSRVSPTSSVTRPRRLFPRTCLRRTTTTTLTEERKTLSRVWHNKSTPKWGTFFVLVTFFPFAVIYKYIRNYESV